MFQIYLAILALITLGSLKLDFVKTTGIKIIYNTIYFYSACQIKCTQVYNYLLPYFKNAEVIDKIKIEGFDIETNKLTNILENDLQNAVNDTLFNTVYIVSENTSNNVNNNNKSITNKLILDKFLRHHFIL